MSLGKITGKSTTLNFEFIVEDTVRKFEYLQVPHPENDYVLCQIVELIKIGETTTAKCNILGYRKDVSINHIRIPFDPGTEVFQATEEFISETISLEKDKYSAHIGKLQGKNIDVFINLRKALAKHICVLAKSGSGKSYSVGVLLEEIIEKGIPILIIDPHGEYNTLKYPGEDEGIAKGYIAHIQEYGDMNINQALKPLKLSYNMTADELVHILPSKLNPNQIALLYSCLKNLDKVDFESLMLELEIQDNPSKWTVVNMVDYLRKKELFSLGHTAYNELVQPGKCSIINLKGVDPEIQEIIVYKLMKDLFQERKKETIPPFFAVIEEAHNYCPERSFGEAKSSKILRNIASEGRKFGLGLCVISQRPSRVDKSVLSQCSTQIILKVTNPHDLRAISTSVEGMTSETESEIKNLAVGEAIVTGVVDMPLFVDIRNRRTKHGGEQVNILNEDEIGTTDIAEGLEEFEKKDIMPLILPATSRKDLQLMEGKDAKITTYLVPAVMYTINGSNILIDLINSQVIKDLDNDVSFKLPDIEGLSPNEKEVLKLEGKFTPADVMMKLGLDFSSSTNMCVRMKEKELLDFDDKYSVKPGKMIDLAKCGTYKRIEFKNVDFDVKLDAKISADDMRSKIINFEKIDDEKDCFIVWNKLG
ncbi:ATP-binding protein [candidate division KSB1 bacterium]